MTSGPGRHVIAVELNGYGQVGRALLPLLRAHGIGLALIRDRSGVRLRGHGEGARVFVDATSPQYDGLASECWIQRLEEVLEQGTPVVTCNKAPLALGWRRLTAAAQRGRTTVSCSGTVGGGTPVLLLLHRLHQSHGVERIEASLNATLGFVCHEVAAGSSISAAVTEARQAGIAEPDPTLDLDGTDLHAKAVIVHNLLFTHRRPIALEPSRHRLRLDEGKIRRLAELGGSPRVVSTITPLGVSLKLTSSGRGDPSPSGGAIASVRATLKDGSETSIAGPGAGARATAGALLGDLLELSRFTGETPVGVIP